jgi:hypothetical protein
MFFLFIGKICQLICHKMDYDINKHNCMDYNGVHIVDHDSFVDMNRTLDYMY